MNEKELLPKLIEDLKTAREGFEREYQKLENLWQQKDQMADEEYTDQLGDLNQYAGEFLGAERALVKVFAHLGYHATIRMGEGGLEVITTKA